MPTLILSVSGARGLVGDGLDAAVVVRLAGSLGSLLGPGRVILGRDSRKSGDLLAEAVRAGLRGAGCDVLDFGVVPTPTVQVLVEHHGAAGGVVISASHNPPQWNALKFVGPEGRFLDPERAEELFTLFRSDEITWVGHERLGTTEWRDDGIAVHVDKARRILPPEELDAIRAARMRVVVDAVHGAGGVLILPLLESLGVDVHPVGCEPDGDLPDDPEPRAEALGPLQDMVKESGSRLGFRLDPDGDRLAVVTPGGEVCGEEWTLPLAAIHTLSSGKGPLVTNLSTSSRLETVGREFGVPVHRTPVGEAHVVRGILRHGARLGGEGNGGVIDPSVHLGRDAAVGMLHLLALEATRSGGVASLADRFPPLHMVKVKTKKPGDCDDLFARLRGAFDTVPETADGLRWALSEGWVHVRVSGTEPVVRITAEAKDRKAAEGLVERVRRAGRL